MARNNKGPSQNRKTTAPGADKVAKENQREKAEGKEVAGRRKNDGQKDHKASRLWGGQSSLRFPSLGWRLTVESDRLC